jgi:hypothetical protein
MFTAMYGKFDPADSGETALAEQRLKSVEGISSTGTATPAIPLATDTHS